MIEALSSINAFPVPTSDQTITISLADLKDMIKEALQPLRDEISRLREEIDQDHQEIAAMRAKLTSLESLQEQDINSVTREIALDRQRIFRLENPLKEPGKTEASRAEKIEKYLASRPDHKATFETLKGMLQINNVLLHQTIKTLMDSSPGRYGVTKAPGDKRKRTLVMLPK